MFLEVGIAARSNKELRFFGVHFFWQTIEKSLKFVLKRAGSLNKGINKWSEYVFGIMVIMTEIN